ncbi:(deoxy)nucleoside triphosphate pyrophosphohydrolase [Gordonia sp. Z-3]|jgi:mutator protein MutT|uniref:8-oxo-dGTP diphosphatase n=1 Tax=Gordonia aquimaris TaxID=2984863 RepID=A0A9X3D4D4_9ACTN|nr:MULTISPECIES: (deoxy)nucleoside triphosphate pyrophosphohydrolase [Gordonia]MCX2964763.1 (deoxy)nucleoside triphosphate pyrophosphohydrolase [Gordonia aquimaris]MED5800767.1 (deoxy)nucleoside triphosphate pyrophosphohydrolase [Gordonia sp. Z-3]
MTGHRIVVAGAVLDRDRLLLAQRRYPPDLAGLWELPGGKVEAGESPADALRRELREELGVTIAVGAALRESVALTRDLTLVALRARIECGTPHPAEHEALRWVDAPGLRLMHDSGRLVPADNVWVPELLGDLGG